LYPVLFQIGSFKVHSFGVMLVIAFFVGLQIARKRAATRGIDPAKLADAALWVLLWGVLGARLVYILQNVSYYRERPGELLSWQFQGLTSFGAILAGLLYLVYWARKCDYSLRAVLDTVGPAMLIGQALGRVGCLLNGCCYGGICPPGFPLGITVHDHPGLYHPAQMYDAAINVGGYFLLLWRERRGLQLGQAAGLFLVFYNLARFISEFWRAGVTGELVKTLSLTQAQVVSLILMIVGLAIFVRYGRPTPNATQEVGLA